MMRELNYRWKSGNVKKHLMVRFFWPSRLRHAWSAFCQWALRKAWDPPRFSMWSDKSNGRCYCLDGRSAYLQAHVFEFGVSAWFNSDWAKRPCVCDIAMAELFPESYSLEEVLGG